MNLANITKTHSHYLFFLICISTINNITNATDWKYIQTYPNGNKAYYDADTFQKKQEIINLWIKVNNNTGNLLSLSQWLLDCKHYQKHLLKKIVYNNKNHFLTMIDYSYDSDTITSTNNWEKIHPFSNTAKTLTILCNQ